MPLEISAVIAAQGPGIQITSIFCDLASLIRSSPGSQMPAFLHHLPKQLNCHF